ncbi:uncharacterized protein LOC136042556 [Artemia franciscana]|uniref:Uncharacterized protein n=1 Tax=Artemia franciscana TaxID=6661 RepID=A0AA88L012_ARTSF|nr:hypothetical protein QYM36_018818 [Artemia franciscana]
MGLLDQILVQLFSFTAIIVIADAWILPNEKCGKEDAIKQKKEKETKSKNRSENNEKTKIKTGTEEPEKLEKGKPDSQGQKKPFTPSKPVGVGPDNSKIEKRSYVPKDTAGKENSPATEYTKAREKLKSTANVNKFPGRNISNPPPRTPAFEKQPIPGVPSKEKEKSPLSQGPPPTAAPPFAQGPPQPPLHAQGPPKPPPLVQRPPQPPLHAQGPPKPPPLVQGPPQPPPLAQRPHQPPPNAQGAPQPPPPAQETPRPPPVEQGSPHPPRLAQGLTDSQVPAPAIRSNPPPVTTPPHIPPKVALFEPPSKGLVVTGRRSKTIIEEMEDAQKNDCTIM